MKTSLKFQIREVLKKFGIVSNLYWKFFYCPAALQMDLSELEVPNSIDNKKILKIPTDSSISDAYVDFINVSYDEKTYSKESLSQLLHEHHYLKDIETFVLLDEADNIIGSISAGVYQEEEQWCGIIKFAVSKTLRGQGLGLYLLRYAYCSLRDRGCLYGESIVSDRHSRIPSLMSHFKCGFKPQTDREKIQFSVCRGKYNRLKGAMTNRWVMKYYRAYLKKHPLLKGSTEKTR